ncbi:MAG TPA: filamentous hemagglutinin N-terminal domain-containing protein [Methylomirabilota bacterium]|nr:filamentous hemagglutinin N-terminal domain-containing protein [Methylomirabilota bacterium]
MAVLLGCVALWPAPSLAQITLDGSLGPVGPLTGPNYQITPDLGQIRGPNLFHSFGRFNVGTGETAAFSGPSTIANILARVTGGERSTIDGQLRSEISGANLFLLNPSGVLFGPNASLDVSGAFHVSTADVLRLADGGAFVANPNAASVLTTAPPAAFGFLGPNPASITISGSELRVSEGQTLSVVGGDVKIEGRPRADGQNVAFVQASGGRLNVVSVGSAGNVPLDIASPGAEVALDSFARLGAIELSDRAFLDASGASTGTVVIRGGRLVVDSGFVAAFGSANGPSPGIDIRVRDDVTASNSSQIATGLGAFTGRAADIELQAARLTVTGGTSISSNTGEQPGSAGDIRVTASESVAISGSRSDGLQSQISSFAVERGDAGRITVSAPTVNLTAGGQIATAAAGTGRAGEIEVQVGHLTLDGGRLETTTFGAGQGGSLTVNATEAVAISGRSPAGLFAGLFSGAGDTGDAGTITVRTPVLSIAADGLISATSLGDGRAGDIEIQVGRLTADSGARIESQSFGAGSGGAVTVSATESVTVSGRGPFASAILSETRLDGTGDAGQINISAPVVTVNDGAEIGTSTLGSGRAGTIELEVGRLTLLGGGRIASNTLGAGPGGTVTVRASESVTISGETTEGIGSAIASEASGSGAAGHVTVSAPTLVVTDGGGISGITVESGQAGDIELNVGQLTVAGGSRIISRTAGAGSSGRLTITASESVTISGSDAGGVQSGLFSDTVDVFGPVTGSAGRISISTPKLTLTDGGTISTATRGSGAGGDIEIDAARVDLSGDAAITARSAATGTAGNILVVGDQFASRGSRVTTEALSSDGGSITFQVSSLVHLLDSQVTTSVGTGQGRGGNITIDPQAVVLNGSEVRADAFGGPGGNVLIVADVFLTSESVISASSALGFPGTVTIQTAVSPAETQVAPLPKEFGTGTALLAEHCAVRASERRFSTFVLGGRDGIPAEPGGLLPSPLDPGLVSGPVAEEDSQPAPSRVRQTPRLGCSK